MRPAFKIDFPDAKIGKDEKGLFLLSKKMNDKIYLDEIFEDYLDSEVSLSISNPLSPANGLFTGDQPKYPADVGEAHKVMKALDLQVSYPHIRPNLNIFNWLTQKYHESSRKFKFKPEFGESKESFSKWQKQVKEKTKELLGFPYERCPLEIEWGPSADFKGIRMTKVYYTSQPGLKVSAVLSRPIELKTPAPAAIALNGHNNGKITILGFDYSSSHSYYGFELAQRGFVTLTIDQWGWGERYGIAKTRTQGSEHNFALSALLLGQTAIGIRVWDVIRGFDFLETLDYVDSSKFVTIGQSGGGTTSAFAGALDDRVQAAVISGYYCTLFDSIFSLHHCGCNFVPNLLTWADLPEIVGIRAPKPTFIISGDRDSIFPQNGVQTAYHELQEIYHAAGAPDNLGIDVWRGHGHEFRGDFAYPWLEEKLGINKSN
jgi:dienelactone hydrolase